MGKRKERRLAAKIGAGRRVKLDLFAEPSGDLGGPSTKDEGGEDMDAKIDPELPDSPSSSGQQKENPLSLLGQYSDDELDDVSNKTADVLNKTVGELSDDKQAKGSASEQLEEGEIGGSEEISSQKADNQDLERDSASATASLIVGANAVTSNTLDEKHHEVDIEKEDPPPLASDTQTAGGVNSSWKMVLHEESNRYYYWNTDTGETSWEVPDGLVQGTALTSELETLGSEIIMSAAEDINGAAASEVKLGDMSATHGVGYTNGISDVKAYYEQGAQESQYGVHCETGNSSSMAGVLPYETSSYSLSELYNTGVLGLSAGSYEVDGHSVISSEQGALDLPSHLMKRSEALLEKLKPLQRFGIDSDVHVWSSRYMVELEVRLSDIRALLPYGSSLDPFWMHLERQLSQLENAISIETENHNKISGSHSNPTEGKEVKQEYRAQETKVDRDLAKLSPAKSSDVVHDLVSSAVVQNTLQEEGNCGGSLSVSQISACGPSTDPRFGQESGIEGNSTAVHGVASPKLEYQSDEDVDMDIDMEVEAPSPAGNSAGNIVGQLVASSEPSVQPTSPIVEQPESEFVIPPPPEEEWIPPPPPDNEDIPPPPPDEPPEFLCAAPPPSEPEPVQSVNNEQYNLTYAESNANYYGDTCTVSAGSTFYEHADGSQMAALSLPVYYATVPNSHLTAMLNTGDTAAFYGLQNGALPIVPMANTIGSSSFHVVSGHLSYEPLSTGVISSTDAEASSVSKHFVDSVAPSFETGTTSIQASSASVVSAPATVFTKEYTSALPSTAASSVTSTSAAVSEASAAVSKAQHKGPRMKKPKVSVASSLRSNKKVSSMVDKWKAAKEELQEQEEEERETPFDILEKKRRREIEAWRAQQIASGEAQENANFQPLGGDWRERVKRRRAKKEASVEKPSDPLTEGTKQPDLSDLSKGLPLGWQAVWDDSSRQVYYANPVTSETSWTRPTK